MRRLADPVAREAPIGAAIRADVWLTERQILPHRRRGAGGRKTASVVNRCDMHLRCDEKKCIHVTRK